MLVLSRKTDQTILIGNDIKITVVKVNNGNVRIGIDAPKDIPVHRKEVWEAIQANNKINSTTGEQK